MKSKTVILSALLLLSICVTSQESNKKSADFGVLHLPDGSKFVTTIYELTVLGKLRTKQKMPYYILSGRGCEECDANTSTYIHSPSDGPMKNEGEQPRYAYPGKQRDYETGKAVYESRLFFGDCLPDHPNAAIWFERSLGDDNKWHEDVFVAEVKGDLLIEHMFKHGLPRLADAESAVTSGTCQEVPGVNGTTEP